MNMKSCTEMDGPTMAKKSNTFIMWKV